MNIIIPAAGKGRRFAEESYRHPKPLIRVLGEPMIFYVLRSLKVDPGDMIHIVYTQEFDRYSFRHLVKKEFSHLDLNFIPLNFHTRGPAETVLCGLNQIADLDEKVLVVDSDTFYEEDIIGTVKAEAGNCVFYFTDHGQEPIYSYLEISEGRITGIREKERISNHACAGAYAFQSGRVLKQYCETALNAGHRSGNEYYISNLIDLMLGDGEIVIPIRIEKFHCLGTPHQLKTYCINHRRDVKRFCFDVDGTLVTFPEVPGDYQSVRPIHRNIRLLKYLHERGHVIILQTARRMLSSHHNSGLATRQAYRDLFDTLDKFDIPFDEIYFGKPHAHYYIDDLGASPFDLEKEIGFYATQGEARHFNQVQYGENSIVKKTNNPGEIYWYQNIPPALREHFPKVLLVDGQSITMEKIDGIPFSYLLINNSLTCENIENLMDTVGRLHTAAEPDPSLEYDANYIPKMIRRYSEMDYQSISFTSARVLEILTGGLAGHIPQAGVIHGDLVFSNIFLCNRQFIRFIDMRGMVGEVKTIFGDVFYDYAKIYQSLYGYDFIHNDCEINGAYLRELRELFEMEFTDRFSAGKLEALKYITAGLLFSMLPLHDDLEKKQKYFDLIAEIIP